MRGRDADEGADEFVRGGAGNARRHAQGGMRGPVIKAGEDQAQDQHDGGGDGKNSLGASSEQSPLLLFPTRWGLPNFPSHLPTHSGNVQASKPVRRKPLRKIFARRGRYRAPSDGSRRPKSASHSFMPSPMASTNRAAPPSRKPIRTIAGAGQRPTSPHPIPKMSAPPINFASIVVIAGICEGSPVRLSVLFSGDPIGDESDRQRASITRASEGSQSPARSRKASTLRGSVMPEGKVQARTAGRRSRARDEPWNSSGQQMADDEDGRETGRHEDAGRDERSAARGGRGRKRRGRWCSRCRDASPGRPAIRRRSTSGPRSPSDASPTVNQ